MNAGRISLFFSILIVSAATAVSGQTAIETLAVDRAVERDIHEGEVQEFQISLQTASLALGKVEQQGASVALNCFLPDGSKTRQFTRGGGRPFVFRIVGEASGMYRLELTARKGSGRYRIELDQIQPMDDRLKAAAVSDFSQSSPRLAKLRQELAAGNRGAIAEFWREMQANGTPLVEPREKHENQMLVSFLWRATFETHNVLVVWSPFSSLHPEDYRMEQLADSDVWYRTLPVPKGARFQYQLSPNDNLQKGEGNLEQAATRQMDPLNRNPRRDDPNASKYQVMSVVELPGTPEQPWGDTRPQVPAGKIDKAKITSDILKNERNLSIYLPPGYDTRGEAYPLLILFDDSTHLSHIPVPTTLDNLAAARKIPFTVAVFVDTLDYDTRERELNCNDKFNEFLNTELVPWVRKNYHVTTNSRRTIVGGVSYGGLAAAYAAFRHPETFGNVLSQSGTFWWAPTRNPAEPEKLDRFSEPNWMAKQFAASPKLPLRFFLDVGTFECDVSGNGGNNLETARHLRDVLLAKGYDVYYQEFVGGHDRSFWRGLIADALIDLLGPEEANSSGGIADHKPK